MQNNLDYYLLYRAITEIQFLVMLWSKNGFFI